MLAKVIKEFPGRKDDEADTRILTVGEIIGGDLAAVAVREKWAEEYTPPPEKDPNAKPEFSKLTVEELKTYAADRQIDLGAASLKADIIAAIEAAEKPVE